MEVGQLDATFNDLVLPFGLTVDVVRLTGANVRLRHDPFAIELEQPGQVAVALGEANLQDFLEKEAPGGLRDFQIKLTEGKVFVEASVRVVLDIRATAICTLRIVDGTQLWVDLEEVEVLGVGARSLVEKQLEKINPVLDVSSFPLDIELQKVTVLDGQVVLQGLARPR